MKKWLKRLGAVLLVILIILVINFIPVFNKQESGMVSRDNEYFTFYYFEDDEGAEDVYNLGLTEAPRIIENLRLDDAEKFEIYIYDDQETLQRKSIGFVSYLTDLPWFIGGFGNNQVVMVSPAAPNELHDYDALMQTILHEIGHAYNYQLNPQMDLWIDEGMAMVHAGQGEGSSPADGIGMTIPTFQETQTENSYTFSQINGYFYARLYADYLIEVYGYDAWLQLLKTNDYDSVYGKDQEDIYNEWLDATIAVQESM